MVVVALSVNYRCQYQQHTTRNHARSSYYSRQLWITPWLQQSNLIEVDSPVTVDALDAYIDWVEFPINSHPYHGKPSPPRFCPSHRCSHLVALTHSPCIYSYTCSSSSSTEEVVIDYYTRSYTRWIGPYRTVWITRNDWQQTSPSRRLDDCIMMIQ
jgi:hypothetical protein